MYVAYTNFEAGKGIMDALVGLEKGVGRPEEGNNWRVSPSDTIMGRALS